MSLPNFFNFDFASINLFKSEIDFKIKEKINKKVEFTGNFSNGKKDGIGSYYDGNVFFHG